MTCCRHVRSYRSWRSLLWIAFWLSQLGCPKSPEVATRERSTLRPPPTAPSIEKAKPIATLLPVVPGEPLVGTLDGKHARAVDWTPVHGPPVRLTLVGTKLTANYHSAQYGEVRDAFWPNGCGTVGPIRWTLGPTGKVTLTCAWHDSPSHIFTTLRWNAHEGDVELDDSGVISAP